MPTFVRTSKHSLKSSNKHKLEELNSFILEYKRVANLYLDYIWDNNLKFSYSKDKKIFTYHFNNKNKLDLPHVLSTIKINREINLTTNLTARTLKCCLTQVLSIIRGNVEKQKKRQYVINSLRSKNKKIPRKLRKVVKNQRPSKPDLSTLRPELNSICIDFQEDQTKAFDAFVQLKSFIKARGKTVNFPVKYHKISNKWKEQGKRLNSFLFSPDTIEIRYEVEKKTKKDKKLKKLKVVGADQGLKTLLTLSDTQTTPLTDKHGHSLESISKILSRKKKGSQAFKKTQEHRKNFINYSLNKLNFSNIKEIRLEKVKRLRYKSRSSRYLSHWTYTEITSKLKRLCEEKEVLLTFQSSVYRSQRCSQCGLVRKSQRKGKIFSCKNCDLEIDADLNASLNHQQDLPEIPYDLRRLNLNRVGFFWSSTGFYSLTGEEFTVSLPRKVN